MSRSTSRFQYDDEFDQGDPRVNDSEADPNLDLQKYWVGVHKPEVERTEDTTHWSQLPKPRNNRESRNWTDSDNSPESPLEADLER